MPNKRDFSKLNIIEDVLLFLLCAFPSIYTALKVTPVVYPSDCTSAISIAASIAGYDWREVVSHAGYYGFGYLFIFFPLYLLELSPIVIYRTIAIFGAILIGYTPIIAKKILHGNSSLSKAQIFIISFICGQASICNATWFTQRNEEALLFCIWMITLYLFRLMRDNKNRKYERILAFLLGYICTLHARGVILIPLFMFAYIMYRLFFKTSFVRSRFWVMLITLSVIVRFLTKLYQNFNWESSTKNTSVIASASNVANVPQLDTAAIKGFFMIASGILYTQIAITGGIVLLCVIVTVILLFRLIIKRKAMLNIVLDDMQQKHTLIAAIVFVTGLILQSMYL